MTISKSLMIMQMNDSHAYLDLHQKLFWNGEYARIAAILEQTREDRPGQVLAFDGGDTIHGTYTSVKTRGEVLIPI